MLEIALAATRHNTFGTNDRMARIFPTGWLGCDS